MIAIEHNKINNVLEYITAPKQYSAKQSGWLQNRLIDSAITRCLAATISILDKKIDPRAVYESIPFRVDHDIEYLDFISAMANLGYESHSIVMNANQIDERLLPCVYEKNNNYFIILEKHKRKEVINVYDPQDKTTKYIPIKQLRNGRATVFKKIDDQEKGNPQLNFFYTLLKHFKPIFKSVLIASFAINILALSVPIFVMIVYDKVISANQEDIMYYLLLGMVIALITEALLRLMRASAICWVGARLDALAGNSLFQKIIYMNSAFTENAGISAQISKIKSFESIRSFFNSSAFVSIIEMPFVIIMLAAIALIAGSLVLVPIISLAMGVLLILIFSHNIKAANKSAAKAYAKRQEDVLETFAKKASFRHNGITDTWLEKFKGISANSCLKGLKANYNVAMLEILIGCLISLTTVVTAAVGIDLIWKEQITIGALIATMIIVWRVLSPLQVLSLMIPKSQHIKSSISQLNKIMAASAENNNSIAPQSLTNIEGYVELINVGVRYNQNALPVFSGLSVKVSPGEMIAITGQNGSGKSTILKLINKLLSPQIGSIRIDNIDIQQINVLDLRQYIDYVPQIPSFFEGTVRDNLQIANPICSDNEINIALEKVGALADVNQLPEGLDTVISGDMNNTNSSLAYQIALARSLLKKSNIILLDELPFSLLNSKTGLMYINFLRSLKGKKTVFYISHREDHIEFADKVVVLQKEKSPQIIEKNI